MEIRGSLLGDFFEDRGLSASMLAIGGEGYVLVVRNWESRTFETRKGRVECYVSRSSC